MRWVFQRKAAGRAGAYRLARRGVGGGLVWRGPCASVLDVACSDASWAVVAEGSKSGERGSVLAGDAADLGHAHQNSDCGSQSDTVDADDQVEPFGQIAVLADCRCQGLELAVQK